MFDVVLLDLLVFDRYKYLCVLLWVLVRDWSGCDYLDEIGCQQLWNIYLVMIMSVFISGVSLFM